MKNLFLSLAFILIGTLGFANNSTSEVNYEIKEVADNCFYTITTTVTYPSGLTYTYTEDYSTTATSLSNCIEKARNHARLLSIL
jgi:hypothetical protein